MRVAALFTPLALCAALLAHAAPATAQAWTVEHELAVTADGEVLSAKRLKNAGGIPVILFPGIGSNLHEFDLPSRSLARYLADRGWDVWLFTNRRTGGMGFVSTGIGDHSIDDLIVLDVPAAIDEVRRATGERPFVGGHSQGGLISLYYLAGAVRARVPVRRELRVGLAGVRFVDVLGDRIELDAAEAARRNASVRGLVALAAPPRLAWPAHARVYDWWRYSYWDHNLLLWSVSWTLSANIAAELASEVPGARILEIITDELPRFPFVGPSVRPFLQQVAAQVGRTYLVAELMAPGSIAAQPLFEGLDRAVDNVPTASLKMFMDGIRREDLREQNVYDTLRRPTSYPRGLPNVTAPTIWFGGTKDKLANDDTIAAAVQLLGASDKTFVRVPHGHVDLVIGDAAPQNVWDPLERWLAAHR